MSRRILTTVIGFGMLASPGLAADPTLANKLLDEIGLTERGLELPG
jgi:hypothetical protein